MPKEEIERAPVDAEIITISADVDVMSARLKVRHLAGKVGISGSDLTLLATAVSEIARNIVQYAGCGEIEFRCVRGSGRRGLEVVARDQGPGIDDIAQAMQDGFTTSRGMGMGLPGAKRIMDEFEIVSETGKGTVVSMIKWERCQPGNFTNLAGRRRQHEQGMDGRRKI